MGKKFDWRTFSFKENYMQQLEQFSSDPVLYDGEIVTTVDQTIKYYFHGGGITRENAMGLPAVARGRNMICNIATLPLVMYDRANNVVTESRLNSLITQINPDFIANVVTLSKTVEDLVFEGKAYWIVDLVNSSTLYPTKAHYIEVAKVSEQENGIWVDGRKVDPNTVIRFDSPNPALLEAMTGIIKRALATANTSEMYARNPMPKLLFSPKADVDTDADETREAIQNFADSASDSPYNYVGAALDAKPLEFLSPTDLQLVELEKNIERGVANFFGLDPEDLGISTTSRTYQNAVDRRKDRINDVLNPYIQAIEQRLSMGDVTPTGYFVRFSQDDYLRADPKTQMEYYTGYLAAGVMDEDEVRARIGLPPMTPEQKALVKPEPVEKSFSANFSADSETFTLDTGAEFSAFNEESRTVKVLAAPWNKPSRLRDGRYVVFTPNSISYPSNFKQVKLLRDHVYTFSGGYMTGIENTPEGLVATFKISNGPEGDRILAGFIEGNYDHASVGLEPINPADTYTDKNYPGHTFVRKAHLREVSQVAIPAFEDAKLINVRASGQGEDMTDNLDGAAEIVAPEKTYTQAELASLFSVFNKSTETPAAPANDIPAREAFKGNSQEKDVASTYVAEPVPYRFDGQPADHEFSADLISLSKHDDPATRARINDFLKADFAVSTSNAGGLNPTVQRPDLWVGQMDIRTPIMDAIYKGAPTNGVTPFSFPKYNSSSTLVADHTEGTEPTLGAYSVTNQTVTPTALSGKIEVNREAWDQGGSPALSQLIRTEMHRAYNEGLETSAAAFLDGLTLTGKEITITTAAADSTLEGLMIDALIALQGDRGGQYLTEFLSHVDLYKALAKAKDSAGRRLFPAVGPNNATGTVSSKFASLDMNGYLVRMAPALGATGTVAENSYLFDPAKVYGWATTPQDLTFDIQVKSIYLGIWGYKAFALRDINGIRRFIYDPA